MVTEVKKRIDTPRQRERKNELRRARRAAAKGPGRGAPGCPQQPRGLKRFMVALAERPLAEVDLTGLRRCSGKDGGGVRYISKEELRRRRHKAKEIWQVKRREKAKRKREWAKRIAAREGNSGKPQGRYSRGTSEPQRQPIGVYERDRLVLFAFGPGWQTCAELMAKIEIVSRPRTNRLPTVNDHRRDVMNVLRDRLLPAGLIERNQTDASGGPRNPCVFWRLTEAGRELRSRLKGGFLPARVAYRSFIPVDAGGIPSQREALCAMLPGEWMAVQDICGVSRGLLAGRTRLALARFVREGAVERAMNEEALALGLKPGENGQSSSRAVSWAQRTRTPRWLWRLTERGVELRAQWVLEDRALARAERLAEDAQS